MKRKLSLVAVIFLAVTSFAQVDEVTITVLGTGVNEEQATLQALRSAIEQTFGVFVSSNTTILNDKLVQDEIVSISTGNVREYKKLAVASMPNGHISVSLTATVSINRLKSYAEGKGVKVEYAGSVYATNAKLFRLKIKSIEKAYALMAQQMVRIAKDMFDFKFEMSAPKRYNFDEVGDVYYFDCYVGVVSNDASDNFYNLYMQTVENLKLTEDEIDFCKQENIELDEDLFGTLLPSTIRGDWNIKEAIFDACYRYKVQEIGNAMNLYSYRGYSSHGNKIPLGVVEPNGREEKYCLYSELWKGFLENKSREWVYEIRYNDNQNNPPRFSRIEIKTFGMDSRSSENRYNFSQIAPRKPINGNDAYYAGPHLVAIHQFRIGIPAKTIEKFNGFELVGVSAPKKSLSAVYQAFWDYKIGKITESDFRKIQFNSFDPFLNVKTNSTTNSRNTGLRGVSVSTQRANANNTTVRDVYRSLQNPSRSSNTNPRGNVNQYRSR